MNEQVLDEFLKSENTLRVYAEDKCLFFSNQGMLYPLLEYIGQCKPDAPKRLTVLDKVLGNAAALLAIKAGAKEIYAPIGSELAARTLDKYEIEYRMDRVVPNILAANGKDMCPMERLSINKTPDELYSAIKEKQRGKI
jgi:hypothetical protein